MLKYRRPRTSDWIAGVLVGALLGALFLGVGGRVGMRVIALAQGQSPSASFEGSLAVVFLGAACGAAIGAIFLVARTLFPQRSSLRVLFFWTVVGWIVIRGLSPLTAISAVVFMPLFAIHGALLFAYWCRIRIPETMLRRGGA